MDEMILTQFSKEREKRRGMASPDRRSDMLLFWEGPRARIAWESGNAQLEILRSPLLGFQGGSSLNSLLAIQAYLGGDFPFFRRGRKRG